MDADQPRNGVLIPCRSTFEAEAAAFDALPETLKAAAGLPASGPLAFLGWLAAQTDKEFDKRPDPSGRWAEGIEACTWHAAKGREWPVVIVSGLDQGFADWPRTLRAGFDGFEDLDDDLAHAGLSWTPAFVTPEVQTRFLADRRAADEAQACAALYVAMTRARDQMVLSLPKPGKTDSLMIDLLRERTGLETEGGKARLGGATLPCAVRQAMAGEARRPRIRPQLLPHAPARPAIAAGGLWRRSPSSLVATPDAEPAEVRTLDLGAPVADRPGAFALATERGTAWRLAFRTLLQRPDLADRLAPATGLDSAALNAIAAQAGALKSWLAARGFEELHFELPLHAWAPDGSETRAVIDCLGLGPAGACVLDHKSGPAPDPAAHFASYLPQLEAYASLASRAFPDRPMRMLAINWMSEGRLSTREYQPTPEQSGRRRMERVEM